MLATSVTSRQILLLVADWAVSKELTDPSIYSTREKHYERSNVP